jgi:hypothetical protein
MKITHFQYLSLRAIPRPAPTPAEPTISMIGGCEPVYCYHSTYSDGVLIDRQVEPEPVGVVLGLGALFVAVCAWVWLWQAVSAWAEECEYRGRRWWAVMG